MSVIQPTKRSLWTLALALSLAPVTAVAADSVRYVGIYVEPF